MKGNLYLVVHIIPYKKQSVLYEATMRDVDAALQEGYIAEGQVELVRD